MPLTPEERVRWAEYSRKAHQKAKENPKTCANECGRDAAPRRKLCYTCRSREWREKNPSYGKSYSAKRAQEIKTEAIAAYGGACRCCGEDQPIFLSLDHVDGGGKKHRQEVFGQRGGSMWAWARRNEYPSSLRLLCFNCNFAEHWGGCPHQKEDPERKGIHAES